MEKTSWKDEPSPKPTVEVLKPDPKAQTAAEPKRVHGLPPTLTLRLSGLTPETPLKGKWGKMMDGGGGVLTRMSDTDVGYSREKSTELFKERCQKISILLQTSDEQLFRSFQMKRYLPKRKEFQV